MLMEFPMAYMTDTALAGRRRSPLALFDGLARTLSVWSAVSRERRALREMGWSRLEDLGLSERDVERETRKPFWLTRRSA